MGMHVLLLACTCTTRQLVAVSLCSASPGFLHKPLLCCLRGGAMQEAGNSSALLAALDLGRNALLDGEYHNAEELYRSALDGMRALFGETAIEVGPAMSGLAAALGALGKHDEAEALQRECFDAWGQYHPATLAAKNKLALLLSEQGQHGKAEAMQREVLEAAVQVLGGEHPEALMHMQTLANMLAKQGKDSEAEATQRIVLKARRAVLGARHIETLATMDILAAMLIEQGRLDEAWPLLREMIEAQRELLAERHADRREMAKVRTRGDIAAVLALSLRLHGNSSRRKASI